MRAVYADNYKGFKNQVVNLSPVSFFVGQNSTGKSSLMSLMHILFSQDFWLNMNFNSKDHPSGLFSDLVSKESGDRSGFTVGSFLTRDPVDGGE